ncbi:MAG: Ig-like domain-containing protein, partial [Anaerolineae bacterium]|nr:Ig-like domain-containing protein [Anaerolineae bacterium]
MTHKQTVSTRKAIAILLVLAGLLLIGTLATDVDAQSAGVQSTLDKVYEAAVSADFYSFHTHVVQTTNPAPKLANVGRHPRTDQLHLNGSVDQVAEEITMSLWSGREGDPTLDIRTEEGIVYGRTSDSDIWQRSDLATDLFAPGGDVAGFLNTAINVEQVDTFAEGLSTGQFPFDLFPDSRSDSFTRYRFDIDSVRYATQIREQMEAQLRSEGKLPLGVELELVREYVEMRGQGEVWVDADNQPVFQIVHLEFPPDETDMSWIEADITTTYSDMTQASLPSVAMLLHQPDRFGREILMDAQQFITTPDVRDALIGISMMLLLAAGGLMVIRARQTRFVYGALAFTMVFNPVAAPLLQASELSAFTDHVAAQQSQRDAAEEEQTVQQELQGLMIDAKFDPLTDPLTAAGPDNSPFIDSSATPVPNDSAFVLNEEGAAVIADESAYRATDPPLLFGFETGVDTDGDGLTDDIELLQLGTDANQVDSDADGISDYAEVIGFEINGVTWYTNPLQSDSNGDGLADSAECNVRADIAPDRTLPSGFTYVPCTDTDGDLTPDVWDYDNDGDGVPDNVDSSPIYVGDLASTPRSKIDINLSGYQTDKALFVDFQIRPTDVDHLFLTNNVYDWPGFDTQGNIQRVLTDTLATYQSELLDPSVSNTDNGDFMLSPMLELTLPWNASNPSAGLPISPTYTGAITIGTPITTFVNIDAMDAQSIQLSKDTSTGEVVAYLPLSVVQDNVGATPVAWAARMLYQPTDATWPENHEARLLWLVMGLSDECDTSGIGSTPYEQYCSADNPQNWRSQGTVIYHRYYADFTLTGLNVREDLGNTFAVVAQNQATVTTNGYEPYLWHLADALDATYMQALLTSGTRFDTAEIATRFDDNGSLPDGDPQRWGIPKNALSVQTGSYADQTAGFAALRDTLLPAVLTETVTSPISGTIATVLFAREETYRGALLGGSNMSVSGDTVTVALAGLESETAVGLNWAPHKYVSGSGWENMEVFDYLTQLETIVPAEVNSADITALLGGPPEDQTVALSGITRLAKATYATYFSGYSNVIAFNGSPVQTESIVEADFLLVPGEKPLVNLSQDALADLQILFLDLATTSLDGETIANADVSALTDASSILHALGVMEQELLYPTAKGVAAVSKGTIGAFIWVYKKMYSLSGISPGGFSGNTFYYGSKFLTVIYVSLLAATYLFGDLNKQGWRIVMNVASVIAAVMTTIYAVMTYAAYGGYSIAAAMGNAKAISRINTVLRFQKVGALYSALLVVVVAIGSLIFTVLYNKIQYGSITYNQLVAQTLATIVIAVVLAVVAVSFVGTILIAFLSLLDAILRVICSIRNDSLDSFLCTGITQTVTEALAKLIYQTDPAIDFDRSDRLQIGTDGFVLADQSLGFVVGNNVLITQTITNTLFIDDHILQPNRLLLKNDVRNAIRDSAFDYSIQQGTTNLHDSLSFGSMSWADPAGDAVAQRTFVVTGTLNYLAGVNATATNLNLSEGFQSKRADCWWTWISSAYICNLIPYGDTLNYNIGQSFALDIFPATFDEFVAFQQESSGAYLHNMPGLPVQVDADGDRLRSIAAGGVDPDDTTWDTDGDGLSDFWELTNDFDPENADTDGDSLSDYWEAFHNTNPRLTDSDYDGLSDAEEVFHPDALNAYDNTTGVIWNGGWEIVYDYDSGTALTTRVESDPLDANGDGDELLDRFERVYGNNPNLAETFNAFNMLNREFGVVGRDFDFARPGDWVTYTVDIENALDTNRRILGLGEAELPPDVLQDTQLYDVIGQQSVNLSGQAQVPPSITATSEVSLTLRAGGIVEDVGTGRRLWLHLNELSGSTFYDDSGTATAHDATCLNNCPTIRNGYLDFRGSDALQVADHPDFDLTTFSVGMWILPLGQTGYRTLITKGGDFQSPFQLRINGNNQLEGLVLAANCTTLRSAVATTPLAINQWQQVTMTFDGFNIRLYQNGNPIGSGTADGVCTTTNERIEIGRRPNGGYFSGFMDEIEITARALEAGELAAKFGDKAVYMTFDEGSVGEFLPITDASGNNHALHLGTQNYNGSLTVIPAQTTRYQGAIGEAIRLGTWEQPSIEHIIVHGALGLEANDDAFTFSAWLKDSGIDPADEVPFTYGERLFSINPKYYSPSQPDFAVTFRNNGNLVVESGWCDDLTLLTVPFFDNTTDWFHFALSVDPTTNTYNLYKNGSLLSSKTWNCAIDLAPDGNGFDFQLGHWWINHVFSWCDPEWEGCPYTLPISWEGYVDEVVIERRALTAAEVATQFEESFRRLELLLDEPPGQFRVVDNTFNAYEATCSGTGACPDTGLPSVGNQGLRFNGDDYMTLIPTTNDLGLVEDSFTVAAWINGTDFSGNNTILGTDATVNRRGLELSIRNGQPFMGFYGSDTTSGTTLTTGEWVHIAFVYCANCTNGTQTIYINGVAAGSGTNKPSFLGTDPLRIGRSASGNYFDGMIDHLVVEERAMTAAQVQALMLEMPVLNLHLDEEYETVAASNAFADTTRFSNDATCSGAICAKAGFNGQMRETPKFDGVDDVLTVAAASQLNLDSYSISLWLRPSKSGVAQTVLDKSNAGSSINYRLRLNSSGQLVFDTHDSACSGTLRSVQTPVPLLLNQWSHVAATFDGFDTVRLYVNGALAAEQTVAGADGACTASHALKIGGNFAGNLDELAIFGQLLTEDEVADLYTYQAAWVDTRVYQLIGVDVDDPLVTAPVEQYISAESDQQFAILASDPSGIANVSATVSAGSAVVNQDGSAWILSYSPPANPQASDTPVSITVTATDGVGRTANDQTQLFIDDVAPTLFIGTRTILSDTLIFTGEIRDLGTETFDASGLNRDSVRFNLYDAFGVTVAGYYSATVGDPDVGGFHTYTVTYPLPANALGRYTFRLIAEDNVGNRAETTFPAFDQLIQNFPPHGDRVFASQVITRVNTTLAGTASGVPYPFTSQSALFHFEETPGSIFYMPEEGEMQQIECVLCLDTIQVEELRGTVSLLSSADSYLDSSGNDYTATCTDCPTNGSSGRLGRALTFDGVGNVLDLAVTPTISTVTQLGLDDSFTLMAWVKPTGVTGIQPVLASPSGTLMLGLDGSHIVFNDGVTTTIGTTAISAGGWVHLAWRYDALNSEQTVFVNGLLDGTTADVLPFAGSGSLLIGGNSVDYFGGVIDEFALYDRALSADEIYDVAVYFNDPVTIQSAELRLRRASDGVLTQEEGTWFNLATTTNNRQTIWEYPIFGAIEGPYQADLRVTDSVGNVRFISNIWSGNIDTKAPEVNMVYNDLGGGNAEISCQASDWSLDTAGWVCPVGPRNDVYEDALWFTEIYSGVQQLSQFTTTLQIAPSDDSFMQACDVYGRCTGFNGNSGPGGVTSDLALWLRSDRGTSTQLDNAPIATWVDQSPSANDAAQTTVASQPTYQADLESTLRGYPTILFDGVDDSMSLDPTLLANGTSGRTTFAVVRPISGQRMPILSYGADASGQRSDLNYSIEFQSVTVGDHEFGRFAYPVDWIEDWRIVSFELPDAAQSDEWQIRVDGNPLPVTTLDGTPQTVNTGTAGATIGNTFGGGNLREFWGNMAEIVHYDRPLGDSERNQIESYLAFKYGLTLDAGVDYVDSSGAVVWDATANAQYHHAVRGLVRDDLTNLNLLQAYPSVESTTLMTITHGNDPSNPAPFANDGTYMVVGHNGVSSGSHLELISGITTIWYSERQWKVQETGTITDTSVTFDMLAIEGSTSPNGTFFSIYTAFGSEQTALFIDADGDGDFSNATIYDQNRTIDGDTVTWTGVDFPDGAVFALIFIRDNENPNIIISTNKSSAARDEIVEFTVALESGDEVPLPNLTYYHYLPPELEYITDTLTIDVEVCCGDPPPTVITGTLVGDPPLMATGVEIPPVATVIFTFQTRVVSSEMVTVSTRVEIDDPLAFFPSIETNLLGLVGEPSCLVESSGDGLTDFASASGAAVQEAIDAASAGATLKIAGDCVGVRQTAGISQTAFISKSLTLVGGYPISPTNWLAASDPLTYDTLLDANGLGRTVVVTGTADVTVQNMILQNGSADFGGAVYHNGGALTLDHVAVRDSTASADGGGIYATAALTVTHSLVRDNDAGSSDGGGIVLNGGALNVINSTVAQNTASNGGGVFVSGGSAEFVNTTIAENSAAGTGGGVNNSGGSVDLWHTILADNTAGTGPDCGGGSDVFANGYTVVGSSTGCTLASSSEDLINTDPLLASLADYGGTTASYALLPGSPAIDIGGSCEATDQRDIARPQIAACDAGAFESHGFTLAQGSGDGQATFIDSPFSVPLVVTVTAVNSAEPIASGIVTYDSPNSGAGLDADPILVTVGASGRAVLNATANGSAGSYVVSATAQGASGTGSFNLTNNDCTYIVTNDNDNGFGSLRDAVDRICVGGTITFADDFTILLQRPITVTNSALTIDGTGRDIIVSGDSDGNASGDVRVFHVASSASVTMTAMTVENGSADSGAGIDIDGGTALLNDIIVQLSTAGSGSGGGVRVHNGGSLTMIGGALIDNSASGLGGGLSVINASANLTAVTVANNTANGGGGINNQTGTVHIEQSAIYNNTANLFGGGLLGFNTATYTLTNSTLSGNAANGAAGSHGGGAMNQYNGGATTLINTTVAYNQSPNQPGKDGLWIESGTLTLEQSVLAGNNDASCNLAAAAISAGYNVVDDVSCALGGTNDQNNTNPLLMALGDWGGETWTHALLSGSPALNTTPAGACATTVDQRGTVRPQGSGCDSGSFEFVNVAPVATNDAYGVSQNVTKAVIANDGVLANDSDANGDTLTAVLVTPPASGTLALAADGSFGYTPTNNFLGTVTFTYRADDSAVQSNLATVTLNVLAPTCFVEIDGDNITDFASHDSSAVYAALLDPTATFIKIAGTCAGVNLTPLDTQLGLIDRSVTIAGGYDSADWLADPDPRAYPTVLDAQGGGRVFQIDFGTTVTLTGMTLQGGSADYGGAIYMSGNELTLSEVTIRDNAATGIGGGIYVSPSSGNLTINRSVLHDNSADEGGALHIGGGLVAITNSTISGNYAETGGGALLQSGGATIVRSATIANNSSLSLTDGLYVTGGTVDMARTIVADHAGGDNCTFTLGTLADSGDNLSDDSTCSVGFTIADARLVALNDNGGSTLTHALQVASPAADALASCIETVDQIGTPRPQNSSCDIGAFERPNAAPVAVDDYYLGAQNETVIIPALTGSLFNDTDAENDPITAQLVTPPLQGTLVFSPDGAIVYTPTVDFEGVITFTYAVTDTYNPVPVNAPATVELTIQPDICFVDIDQDDVTDFAGPTATTLQSAVDAAASSATVRIAGICRGGNTVAGETQTVYINKPLTLEGGYSLSDWSLGSDPTLYESILDGRGQNRTVYIMPTAGNVTLRNVTLRNGWGENGGGVAINGASVLITGTTMTNNTAVFDGGAVWLDGGAVTIDHSTMRDNHADAAGGAIAGLADAITITHSTLSNNSAFAAGGAIALLDTAGMRTTTVNIDQSTISGNATQTGATNQTGGGAMIVYDSDAAITLQHTTIVSNTAPGLSGRGGIWVGAGSVQLQNSIIAYHDSNCGNGGVTSLDYNIDDDGSCGLLGANDQSGVDPLLNDLADNGGRTQTHGLQVSSPAIDAIPAGNCLFSTDQRGMPRPNGDGCDIGAVEAQIMCSTIGIQTGWNMVSLPVLPADASVATLFPNATSPAYAYQNGYVEVSTLELGQSYWLKFDAAETVSVCGQSAPVSNS